MTVATYNCKTRTSVKVRNAPNTSNTSTITMPAETAFQISAIVPDSIDPTNTGKKWGRIFGGANDGLYTALEYPGNISPISTYTPIPDTTPPDPTEPILYPQSVVWEYVEPSTGQLMRINYVADKVLP